MVDYLITGQAYKICDRSKQTELLFYSTKAANKTEAAVDFSEQIKRDGYYLVQLISINKL